MTNKQVGIEGQYSNALGINVWSYPTCIGALCKHCKDQCLRIKGLKWRQGGKECFNDCKSEQFSITGGVTTAPTEPPPTGNGYTPPTGNGYTPPTGNGVTTPVNGDKEGMGTMGTIMIALAVLAALGTAGYFIFRKK